MKDFRKCHVIVGSGPAGVFLCNKLLERDDVILIERGHCFDKNDHSSYFDLTVRRFLNIHSESNLWTFNAVIDKTNSDYYTTEQRQLSERTIKYVQGNRIGGSTNINAMIWTLGNSKVFDSFWPSSWSSKEINIRKSNILLTLDPPIKMQSSGVIKDILTQYKVHSAEKELINNEKGWDNYHTASPYLATITNDQARRNNLNRIIYKNSVFDNDNKKRGKLTIYSNCKVTRINFYNTTAISVIVEFVDNKKEDLQMNNINEIKALNGGEIIICAGVFETPKLLIQSGLKELINDNNNNNNKINRKRNKLPNLEFIGENLQDHVVIPYMMIGNWFSGWDIKKSKISNYYSNNDYPLNGVHGWINLDSNGNYQNNNSIPTTQLLFVDGRISSGLLPEMLLPRFKNSFYLKSIRPLLKSLIEYVVHFTIIQWLCGFCFGILVCNVRPHSKGSVRLDNNNNIIIDPNYLHDPRDIIALHNAMKTAQNMILRFKLSNNNNNRLYSIEVLPGPLFNYCNNMKWFKCYCDFFLNTYYHACGTCGMGRNKDDSVVDENLRVHGITNLRIADASIIPNNGIPSGPIAAICMIIGELAGHLILKEKL